MDRLADTTVDAAPRVVAPDGSNVRVLLATGRGSMAQFELAPGGTSRAVRHRSGEMWRRSGPDEAVTALEPGVCLTLPVGTAFRFRNLGATVLRIVAVTMPP